MRHELDKVLPYPFRYVTSILPFYLTGFFMTGYRLTKLSLAIGLSIATSSALASPQSFMSARSFAMGGTGVAVATPSSAPMDNPAMMASDHHSWNDDFGLMLPSVNARAADEEETVDQVDDIQDVITDLESLAEFFHKRCRYSSNLY